MKNLLIGILIVLPTIFFGQNNECTKYKDGKFNIVIDNIVSSKIERTGTKQIEFGIESNVKFELKVKWLNDCTYTLEFVKFLENPNNVTYPDGMILTVEIIETKENSYIQKTTSNLFDLVLESEMIKIE